MPILLFDGHCNLCNSWIKFIIKRDYTAKIRFASLQSLAGRRLLEDKNIYKSYTDSLVLIEEETHSVNSDGALKTLSYLDSWEKHLSYLTIVPRPLRDLIYRIISNNRYKWFGRRNNCMIPNSELSQRFLTD